MAGVSHHISGRASRGPTRSRSSQALRPALLLGVAVSLVLSSGCVPTSFLWPEHPPVGLPCKLVTQWQPDLVQTQDSVNAGAPLRGLAGPVFLFNDLTSMTRVTCEGTLIVDLYDDRPLLTGGQPVRLERWMFSDEVLKQLVRKDPVGWGYTLFLPWVKTYQPDITHIHLLAAFTP